MFNPTVLLFGLVFAIGLFGSGVSIGYKWSERAHAANLVAVQNATIENANRESEVEKQRALAAAKKEADARLASRTARLKGEIDAAKKSRPECSRDSESMQLLNNAIRSANDQADTSIKLPDTVRPADAPGGWLGTVREKLGVSDSGTVRPVSPPAQ